MSVDADIIPTPTMALPQKRAYAEDDDEAQRPSTPNDSRPSTAQSSALSSPQNVNSPKDTPMANGDAPDSKNTPSKPTTATAELQSSHALKSTQNLSQAPPTKRRKLTPAEKLQQEADKAQKAKERAEKQARKEAEALAKEEEKKRKAEEKELEKKQKEDERKAKEEEKKLKQQEKEEEKRKKEEEKENKKKLKDFEQLQKKEEKEKRDRSQMRLSSFFTSKPGSSPGPLSQGKTPKAGLSPGRFLTKDDALRRSMSLEPVDIEPSTPTKPKPLSNHDEQARQNGKGYLSFLLGKNMRLAKHNQFLPSDVKECERISEAIEDSLKVDTATNSTLKDVFSPSRRTRGFRPPKVESVIAQAQRTSKAPIDLTDNSKSSMLSSVPMKFLFFGEDVRPPYFGTWTRPVENPRTIALNPLSRTLPNVDYDYDSEAEWDDAEDGEDIDVDGEEEEEEDEEEMDGFIDDDNAPQFLQARKGLPANDVEPICSGLQWEDSSGKLKSANANHPDADFSEFAVCFLLDPSPKTIDPYTTAYWEPESKKVSSTMPLMGPPGRLPLADRTNGQSNIQSTLVNGKVPKAAKAGPRLVPADILPAFKDTVSGSDMTKIALIEHLKKTFPKLRKDQITDTLSVIAQRVGAKQADKRWVLLGGNPA